MDEFLESRGAVLDPAEHWQKQTRVEVERRSTLDVVDCAEAWALDEANARLCIDSYMHEDEETGNQILFGAAHMIATIATAAHTKTGQRVNLDEAIHEVKRIQFKNPHNSTIEEWCDLLVACLRLEVAAVDA